MIRRIRLIKVAHIADKTLRVSDRDNKFHSGIRFDEALFHAFS